ncbi:hypothetical protein EKO27_g5923 [Xylaria grammica]|uniref:Uncharacterized protein n=1 Tax=Xylaria grammica TaxID=363999 RepID=A0A439D452_9PEZI|nr:hypothetical protein EKO27_g5923 [Xylaria grammica]
MRIVLVLLATAFLVSAVPIAVSTRQEPGVPDVDREIAEDGHIPVLANGLWDEISESGVPTFAELGF